MQDETPRFLPLAAKTVVCYTLTYFLMGALAFHFLHYATSSTNRIPVCARRPVFSF